MADPKLADDLLGTLGSDEGPFEEIWARCAPYTMTSPERGLALFRAVNYLVSRNVPGAVVECGTWRGGSAMIAMMTLRHQGVDNRPIYLFDTFEGMTNPSDIDVDLHGRSAQQLLETEDPETSLTWARCSVEDVMRNLAAVDYPSENVHLIKGDVRANLGRTSTGAIAVLRLDTDFYDSTMAELRHLYPRLLQHGVILIDAYGHWRGCRRAVDEFFRTSLTEAGHEPIRPFFHSIDYTARIGIRSQANPPARNRRYDYIPRGLESPALLKHFPTLMETDPAPISWPYLRKSIPHIWRTDCRSSKPNIGVLSLEEAIIVYNCAKPFEGRRALEIGCHFGWSTAHILAAGVRLDVIDPMLGTNPHLESVRESLEKAGSGTHFDLWPGYSPNVVPAIARNCDDPWSFVFIDGNHDGDAPLQDAKSVIPYCADTCAVVFHDLISPAVAAGLQYLSYEGWNVRIFNTMQIVGIAWRGDYAPPVHHKDINIPEDLPDHLRFVQY